MVKTVLENCMLCIYIYMEFDSIETHVEREYYNLFEYIYIYIFNCYSFVSSPRILSRVRKLPFIFHHVFPSSDL